jgi:hypothetical protein
MPHDASVTSFKRRMVRIGNRMSAWMYRVSDGRLLSTKNAKVLMITTPGRRTGVLHSTCVRYLETPEGLLSGAPPPALHEIRTGSAICAK